MKQPSLFESEPEPTRWEDADRADLLCAQVAFNLPVDSVFDYLIPDELRETLQPGQRVKVPFGRGDRITIGFCVGIHRPERPMRWKSIVSLVDQEPLLTPRMLELTRWIAERYLCTWGQVLETVVPAGVKNRAGTRDVLSLELNRELLASGGLEKLPAKQAAIVEVLSAAPGPLPLDAVAEAVGCGTGPITELRRKRIVRAVRHRSDPGLPKLPEAKPMADQVLNTDQQIVLNRITALLRERKHCTFLLHGVTGSGKTEVYIRAIREVVSYGRQAIVLVPEISLTPQTIRRFQSRFSTVAVLHSHLSDADRHRHWQQIAQGQVQVVVGARSAVFAPVPQLGLIVIDEEHETTFKQDSTPRYHAREVARRRAELEGVPLILGSATPMLESWQRALTKQDELLQLPKRVEGLPMPPVAAVDIREDPQCAKGAALGRALQSAMHQALERGGQVILFLNLRGFSPVLWCKKCGSAVKCPNCDVSLAWHKEGAMALCHVCGHQGPPPAACPTCQTPGVRYLGTGTQRLEQEVRTRFPKYPCLRMDSDSMRNPGSHDEALESFRRGEVKILLGTQMIAKGLDFPSVTLVGVVDADTMLHQPDLRASERTFQLISQVAGRTGRSALGGRVLVQTSCPTEPSIQRALRHDFVGFARAELDHRKQMNAPPFLHLTRVILRGPHEPVVQAEARRLVEVFRAKAAALSSPVRILGPAPAPASKLKGFYRYHFQLSALHIQEIADLWHSLESELTHPAGVEHAVDVDPLNLR